MSARVSRRQFLGRAAAATAVPLLSRAAASGAGGAAPPSDRIGMGFIGLGTQGRGHLTGGAWTMLPGGFLGRPDVQVLAVCDVLRSRREAARQVVEEQYARRFGKGSYKACTAHADFREVLARPDIDAVVVATPIHWHALMTILAARAGKDVYCEKPTAVTLGESKAMVEAIRRHGRVFQGGTQQRSEYEGRFRKACEWVRSGRIGKLKEVYAYQQGGGYTPGGKAAASGPPAPDGIDWELYLGPAPWRPFDGDLNAHRFGWGDINWGQHHYDIVQWGLGADRTGPVEISLAEGKPVYRYASGVTVHGTTPPGEPWLEGGARFVGSDGVVTVHRNHFSATPAEIMRRPPGPGEVHLERCDSHAGNFLDCVKSRQKTIVDVETAHRAVSVMLLGGVAQQLGRAVKWDPVAEHFVGDPDADRLLTAAMREPWRI